MTTNNAMTAAAFKAARYSLGLSSKQLAHILDTSPTTIRKWEAEAETAKTARGPNPIASRVMRWMLDGYRPPEFPDVTAHEPAPKG